MGKNGIVIDSQDTAYNMINLLSLGNFKTSTYEKDFIGSYYSYLRNNRS